MGTITSGIGLTSGIDIQALVDQLISIEARPRDLLTARVSRIDAQRTAYLDISARISGILSRATSLMKRTIFESNRVTSSNEDLLTATTTDKVKPGSYSFLVQSLASTHQLVSTGFRSRTASLPPGELIIESARARLNPATSLAELNGYRGVQRGSFSIADASGKTAKISTTSAASLDDVLDQINNAGLNITAEVRDNRLVLTETTGGELKVRELDGRHVAADLGLGNRTVTGTLTGEPLRALTANTPLSVLRDGLGIRGEAGSAFTVTGPGFEEFTVNIDSLLRPDTQLAQLNQGNGVNLGTIKVTLGDTTSEIDLTGATTISEVKDRIEGGVEGLSVTLSGGRLLVTRTGDLKDEPLKIEDTAGTAAADLGIAGDVSIPGTALSGREVLRMDTVADVLAAINYAAGNNGALTAGLDGNRLTLTGGAGEFTLTGLEESPVLADLGFADGEYEGGTVNRGGAVLAGVDTVLLSSLNGGRGFPTGEIQLATSAGNVTVDLRGAETLNDVIGRINDAAGDLGIEAGFDSTGLRLQIQNVIDGSDVTISDVSGTFAADTGLAQTGPTLRSANLQRAYLNENTALSDLPGGVAAGTLKLTNSLGTKTSISLADAETLGDVIDKINDANAGVTARINDTGDGLYIEDTAGGDLDLSITDEGGNFAQKMRLRGDHDGGHVDGSLEVTINVTPGQTLDQVVKDINAAGGLATASILSDGSSVAPYRLTLSSQSSGAAGELLVDGAALGLDLSTLSQASDARVVLGDDAGGLVVTSSSNTINNIVPGLNLNLQGVSDQPVTVTIDADSDKLIETIQGMVTAFNQALTGIEQAGSYDLDTEKAGVLLGESTIRTAESRLLRLVTSRIPGATGEIQRLTDVGIRFRDGAVTFDEERFRAALTDNPEAVIEFFTDEDDGAAAYLKKTLEDLTGADGLIPRRGDSLESQKDGINDRIEQLNDLLARRRERLTANFLAMEQALSQIQSQGSALSQIGSISTPTRTGG